MKERLNRRTFLRWVAALSGGTLLDHLPFLAHESGSGMDPQIDRAAIKPVERFLPRFTPSSTPFPKGRNWRSTYTILFWTPKEIVPIGKVIVKRDERGEKVYYRIVQQAHFAGRTDAWDAEAFCSPEPLNPLLSWRVRFFSLDGKGKVIPSSEFEGIGEWERGKLTLRWNGGHGSCRYTLKAPDPLVSPWTLLDFLGRHASPKTPVSFTWLDDFSVVKPDHTLTYDGVLEVRVKGDRNLRLHTFVQSGEGILPIHYLRDREGRIHLITHGFLSWALQGIE